MKRIIAALVVLLSLTVMSVEYARADQLFWTREVQGLEGDPEWYDGAREKAQVSEVAPEGKDGTNRSTWILHFLLVRLAWGTLVR